VADCHSKGRVQIAVPYAVAALEDHPLAAVIDARLAAMQPHIPPTDGYTPVAPGQWSAPITCTVASGNNVVMGLDANSGALAQLIMPDGVSYADPNHLLAEFTYQVRGLLRSC
jgi:hypothetical protein